MSKTDNKKPLFEVEIPEPTDEDLKWSKKIEKKGLGWFKETKLKNIVTGNKLWRMKFLCEFYGDKLDLSREMDSDHWYSDQYLISMAARFDKPDMVMLLDQYGAKTEYIDAIWPEAILRHLSPKTVYTFLLSEEDPFKRFNEVLSKNDNFLAARVFIDGGFIDCDNKALMAAISYNDFKVIQLLVEGGANIPENDNSAIKAAEHNGYFEIAGYLKEKSGIIEPSQKALPAPVQELGSDKYQKLSDVELLKTSISDDGSVTLTSVFNFKVKDIIRTQYMKDQQPSETRCNFNDLEDVQSLRAMFDKLQNLGGNPPTDLFKTVRRVEIKEAGKGTNNVKNKR